MGLFGDIARVVGGVATGGLSEVANAASGGNLFGNNQKDADFMNQFNGVGPASMPDYVSALSDPNVKAIQDRGLAAPGTSAWEKMSLDKNEAERQRNIQDAQKVANNQAAQSRADLALRRGLSSGASERLGVEANKNAVMGGQNADFAAGQRAFDIGTTAENQRTHAQETAAELAQRDAMGRNEYNQNWATMRDNQYNRAQLAKGIMENNRPRGLFGGTGPFGIGGNGGLFGGGFLG